VGAAVVLGVLVLAVPGRADEVAAVKEIEKQGGKVKRDDKQPGKLTTEAHNFIFWGSVIVGVVLFVIFCSVEVFEKPWYRSRKKWVRLCWNCSSVITPITDVCCRKCRWVICRECGNCECKKWNPKKVYEWE